MGVKLKTSKKLKSGSPHRFQPGNKFGKGRPKKGECLTEILRDMALDKIRYGKDGLIERRKALALRMWNDAIFGGKDYNSIRTYLYDRVDGKPLQVIQGDADLLSYLSSMTLEELENELKKF